MLQVAVGHRFTIETDKTEIAVRIPFRLHRQQSVSYIRSKATHSERIQPFQQQKKTLKNNLEFIHSKYVDSTFPTLAFGAACDTWQNVHVVCRTGS